MGWLTDDAAEAQAGRLAGRLDAEADRAAGGVGRGWDGSRRGEQPEAWTFAYDEAYMYSYGYGESL